MLRTVLVWGLLSASHGMCAAAVPPDTAAVAALHAQLAAALQTGLPETLMPQLLAAWNRQDTTAFVAFFADDAVLMGTLRSYQGHAAILDWTRRSMTDLVILHYEPPVQAVTQADYALFGGAWFMTPRAEPKRRIAQGTQLLVWKRTGKGWRIASAIIADGPPLLSDRE